MFVVLSKIVILCVCCLHVVDSQDDSRFDERLIIRPLSSGKVYAFFEFKTFVPTGLERPFQANKDLGVDLFASSLYRLFNRHGVQELSLSFAFGSWRWREAGLPFRQTAPSAHLSVWFDRDHENLQDDWNCLTSELSGLFCSSISTIDSKVTIQPQFSYRPQLYNVSSSTSGVRLVAALAQEAVCKENLHPWLMLLPCDHKYGLARLLTGPRLFDSEYLSISIDFGYTCEDVLNCGTTTGLELKQTIQKVFDLPLMLDGRHSWTLRNLFGASLTTRCPLATTSDVYLELNSILAGNTTLTDKPKLRIQPDDYTCVSHASNDHVELKIVKTIDQVLIGEDRSRSDHVYAHYDLKARFGSKPMEVEQQPGNIGITYPQAWFDGSSNMDEASKSFIEVTRGHTITGVRSASISVRITNHLDEEIDAIYLDMIPWFIRIYVHQIKIKAASLDSHDSGRLEAKRFHYAPSQDRKLAHHLEILLTLPARSLVTIELECTNQYLLWTEFPPDANQGLFINSASVTVFSAKHIVALERHIPTLLWHIVHHPPTLSANLTDRVALYERYKVLHFYTHSKQIPMATPDFSMPYNVICLVSTVLSIAFGPILNITNRRPRLIFARKVVHNCSKPNKAE